MFGKMFRVVWYGGIAIALVLLGQRCASCAFGPDVMEAEWRAAFVRGVEHEIATCKRAGFDRPVWRHTGGVFAFYCTDESGILQPVVAPLNHAMASDPRVVRTVAADRYTPSTAMDEQLMYGVTAEFSTCAKANLVLPVWRSEFGTTNFYCADNSGVMYPVLAPHHATQSHGDHITHRGHVGYVHGNE